jgi:hypothetical protein
VRRPEQPRCRHASVREARRATQRCSSDHPQANRLPSRRNTRQRQKRTAPAEVPVRHRSRARSTTLLGAVRSAAPSDGASPAPRTSCATPRRRSAPTARLRLRNYPDAPPREPPSCHCHYCRNQASGHTSVNQIARTKACRIAPGLHHRPKSEGARTAGQRPNSVASMKHERHCARRCGGNHFCSDRPSTQSGNVSFVARRAKCRSRAGPQNT